MEPENHTRQLIPDLALPDVDGEVDELTVLDYECPELGGLQEFLRLVLEVEGNSGSPLQRGATRILHNAELVGVGLPNVLLVIVMLGRHYHRVRNCITNTHTGKQKPKVNNGQPLLP